MHVKKEGGAGLPPGQARGGGSLAAACPAARSGGRAGPPPRCYREGQRFPSPTAQLDLACGERRLRAWLASLGPGRGAPPLPPCQGSSLPPTRAGAVEIPPGSTSRVWDPCAAITAQSWLFCQRLLSPASHLVGFAQCPHTCCCLLEKVPLLLVG